MEVITPFILHDFHILFKNIILDNFVFKKKIMILYKDKSVKMEIYHEFRKHMYNTVTKYPIVTKKLLYKNKHSKIYFIINTAFIIRQNRIQNNHESTKKKIPAKYSS